MKNAEVLINNLPMIAVDKYDRVEKAFIECHIKVHAFVRDNRLFVSAEYGDNAADYEAGYIAPELIEFAEINKGYWDWYDAGCIVLSC